MTILLTLTILLIAFSTFIIGILISKISINVKNCNLFSNSGIEEINIDKMEISIDLYFFKIFKLISIRFYKEYLKIGFFKVYYYKLIRNQKEIIIKLFSFIKLLFGKNKLTLKKLNPDIEMFYMNLSLCSKDAAVTSIASSIIALATSLILSKFVRQYDEEKIFYKIVPVYFNINGFKIEFRTKIDFKSSNLFSFLYDYYLVKNNN